VVAPLFFAGKIELGVVSQSYGAFNHILSDLSIIVNQFESISAFSAGVDRLGEFVQVREKKQRKSRRRRTYCL
jgi:vitamin B12/bleomycin/antimicrobial peptide transport system ATP-binding/permease protein